MHRDAPLPDPDGDMDGALEQMSTFADAAAKTSADEEIYGSSLTGQQGAHFPPRAAGKAPLPPKQARALLAHAHLHCSCMRLGCDH